jgi:hypothetical protein
MPTFKVILVQRCHVKPDIIVSERMDFESLIGFKVVVFAGF